MSELDAKRYVFLAKMAETADRFEDALENLRKIIFLHDMTPLREEERTLLAIVLKNIVSGKRCAWRTISESRANWSEGSDEYTMASDYRETVAHEVIELCQETTRLIDESLLPCVVEPEDQVFYLKMKADYARYMCEVTHDEAREGYVKESHQAYTDAWALAETNLEPTNSTLLGLALNFSVFHYEIMGSLSDACGLANRALDAAMDVIHQASDFTRKESLTVLQLIRGNLVLWTAPQEEKDDERD